MGYRLAGILIGLALSLFAWTPADAQLYINTVAGGGSVGDGLAATQAGLSNPTDVVRDAAGNVYIVDSSNHRIRRVAPSGVITTVVGTGEGGLQRRRRPGKGGSA